MTPKQRSKKIRRRWRQVIYERDRHRCWYCGGHFAHDELCVDHFWPVFLGGIDDPINFVTACRSCGKLKSHLPPLFFRIHREELARAYQEEAILFQSFQRQEEKDNGNQ